MFYIPLYPDVTHDGEVVSYNGNGGVEAVDIMYVEDDDPFLPRVAIYSAGFDQDMDLDSTLAFEVDTANPNHYIRWQGTTSGLSDPILYLKPITPVGQPDGYCHVILVGERESGSGDAKIYLDLSMGEGDELLRIQGDTDNYGMRKSGSDFLMSLQWEVSTDALYEHIIETFRNSQTDYSVLDIDNKHQLRVFGKSSLYGHVAIGNAFKVKHYQMPTQRPETGINLGTVSTDEDHRMPVWSGVGDELRWYKIVPGDNATISENATLQEIVIDCSCTGGGSSVDAEVVSDVVWDATQKQLKIVYTKLTVQAESAPATAETYIGTYVDVVVDSDVSLTNLRNQSQRLYVLENDAAGPFVAWHQGTECAT